MSQINSKSEEYANIASQYGFQYGLIGLGLGLGASLVASRFSPAWRNFAIGPKTFVVSAAGLAGFVYGSERAAFLAPGSSHFNSSSQAAAVSWRDAFEENKYKIIGSVWALSMLGAMGAMASQNKMKFSEKIVQVRMFAQATTILAVLASAAVSSTGKPKEEESSDAWNTKKAAV